MKHVKLFVALFAMLALGVTNAWAVETITLDSLGAKLSSTSNTELSTTVVGDYTLNYLQGKKQGNAILLAKEKGSFISNKTPIPGAIQSVTVYINNGASGKTTYHCAFSTTECTSQYVTGSTAENISGGNNHTYTCSVENASYFCVSLGNSNNGQVLKLVIEYTPASTGGDVIVKTLKSIAVKGMTTDYETGDIFRFDGTCTATYGVTKNDVPQEDETKEVTPTSVSTPDMSTAGEKEVTVTYTENEVTVTTTYTINVTENVITAGKYALALNNTFFGTTAAANVPAFPTSAKQDNITVTLNGGGTKTRTDADCIRMYKSNTLTFSVPEGYAINSIVLTAGGDWNGSISVNIGTYTDSTKTWAGSAQEVEFSFGAQNRIANATVTYAEAGGTPVEPGEPETPVEPEGPENLGAKTIAEFLALKNTTDTCVLTGVVANIANTTYGNFDLVDATGSVYVYGLLTAAGVSQQFASMDIVAGDTLTVKAIYNEHNSRPQAKNAIYVSHRKTATPIVPENLGAKTIAEFLALKNTTDTCVLTGVVANITNTTYGNFDLVDATGSVYVYGLLTAAGESQQFASMDIAAGDTLTVKAIYNEHNSNPQAKNAIYVSHSKLVLTVAVTSENGTVDGLADGGKYVRGAEATLTATPADGYKFACWTSGEDTVSTENPYTFTVTANVALVANFKEVVTETVYFVNNKGWDNVYVYAWTPVPNAEWPGVAATKEAEQICGYDVYSYTAEAGAYANVIFNNGNDHKTANLDWTAGKYYVQNGWYTREEAEALLAGPDIPSVITYVLRGVGGDWTVGIALTVNPDNENEYVLLGQDIAKGDAVKVVTLTDGVATAWCGNVDEYSVAHNFDDAGNIVLAPGKYNFYFKVNEDLIYIAAVKPGPATALEDIAVEGKAVKAIINGQLIIIKNGVQYNAQGQVIK